MNIQYLNFGEIFCLFLKNTPKKHNVKFFHRFFFGVFSVLDLTDFFEKQRTVFFKKTEVY
jgi:hypothetical protein